MNCRVLCVKYSFWDWYLINLSISLSYEDASFIKELKHVLICDR